MHILLASIRPWRYLLSPRFRAKVNAQHASKHSIIKWWYLLWGCMLLVASVTVVAGLVWFWFQLRSETEPPLGLHQQAVEKIEQVVIDELKKHQGSQQ